MRYSRRRLVASETAAASAAAASAAETAARRAAALADAIRTECDTIDIATTDPAVRSALTRIRGALDGTPTDTLDLAAHLHDGGTVTLVYDGGRAASDGPAEPGYRATATAIDGSTTAWSRGAGIDEALLQLRRYPQDYWPDEDWDGFVSDPGF
ncbi:hypothetical protein ACIQ9E_12395 [Streptomyces sp. NPDC094448]|uniref:hypothetical protein n=1 Tax=Streptomyces sp. NPDC094448 TaxID=3366063 RepID=UPI00381E5874